MFRLKDKNFVTNERGKVVAVQGAVDGENRNIVVENRNGKIH
jgi:hypothetical protein